MRPGCLRCAARPPRTDVGNVRATANRASNLLGGRALSAAEVARLFTGCFEDGNVKSARDAALLAVFYGCGLRRGELARLNVEDFDPDDCSILVQGKRRKQRTVYLSEQGCRLGVKD